MHKACQQEHAPARPPWAKGAGSARTVLAVKGALRRPGALDRCARFRQRPNGAGRLRREHSRSADPFRNLLKLTDTTAPGNREETRAGHTVGALAQARGETGRGEVQRETRLGPSRKREGKPCPWRRRNESWFTSRPSFPGVPPGLWPGAPLLGWFFLSPFLPVFPADSAKREAPSREAARETQLEPSR